MISPIRLLTALVSWLTGVIFLPSTGAYLIATPLFGKLGNKIGRSAEVCKSKWIGETSFPRPLSLPRKRSWARGCELKDLRRRYIFPALLFLVKIRDYTQSERFLNRTNCVGYLPKQIKEIGLVSKEIVLRKFTSTENKVIWDKWQPLEVRIHGYTRVTETTLFILYHYL